MSQGGPTTRLGGAPRKVFYGWRLVGITVFALAVVIGPIAQGMGTFFVALERQFGWSRTVLSGAFSLIRGEGALLGPLEGYLVDRLGARRMVLVGLLIMAAGLIGLSLVQNVLTFYIAFLVLFTGAGLGGFLPLMAAINQWFIRRRTLAMGIAGTGFNWAGLLVPALAWAVTTAGWRAAALALGIFVGIVTVPLALLIRDRPEDYGQRPDGVPAAQALGSDDGIGAGLEGGGDFTVGQAVRTKAFWAITAAHGFSVIAIATFQVHLIPAMTDRGMSLPMAATVLTTYTTTALAFQMIGGVLGDRVPKHLAIGAFLMVMSGGILVGAFSTTVWGAFLFAVLFGVGFGGRIPLLMAIRGDYFGRRNFATILGVSQLPMNMVSMGGPLAAGYLFDRLGSYTLPFLGLALFNLVGAFAILLAGGRPPAPVLRQTRQEPQPQA